MSHNFEKCIHILELVSKIKKESLRNKILADLSCDGDVFGSFCEIAHNYIKGNISVLNNEIKAKLKRKQPALKKLAKLYPKSKLASKRKALQQVGKGWALPLVTSLLSLLKK